MFCTKCGEKLEEGLKFCTKCGTAVNASSVPDTPSQQQVITPLQSTQNLQITILKSLRVMSIIGMVWFPLWFLLPSLSGTKPSVEEYQGIGIFIIGYAIAHAIVALINGVRHKIGVIKVMAILALIWCFGAFLMFKKSFCYGGGWSEDEGLPIFGLGVYALAFSIVSFIKSKFIKLQSDKKISKEKDLKVLRILSIIGIICFPLSLFSFALDDIFWYVFTGIIFGYVFAHAIVALVQGSIHQIGTIKIMAIIGIIWYFLSPICIFSSVPYASAEEWAKLGVTYATYALAFSVVTFVQSRKNPDKNII